MPLPTVVTDLAADHLAAVDAALPGLVTACGSPVRRRPGTGGRTASDVDFVAATSRVPALADVEALAAVHAP